MVVSSKRADKPHKANLEELKLNLVYFSKNLYVIFEEIPNNAKNKNNSKNEFTPVIVPPNGLYCKNTIIGK